MPIEVLVLVETQAMEWVSKTASAIGRLRALVALDPSRADAVVLLVAGARHREDRQEAVVE